MSEKSKDKHKKNDDEALNATDDTKTFDMYHTRSHWTVALGVSFIVALLLFILFLFFNGVEIV